ncbi:MAG: MarR family transcriptional regulator [Mycobacterium sp.]
MVRNQSRPDLAEMLAELARKTVAAEQPVLAAHGLSMWGYIVLIALDRSPIRTQAALAEAIGADKTRIIPTLDELQQQGYIDRIPDPDDRRARLLEITESGRSIKNTVRAAIQHGEERWLGQLATDDRDAFLRALQQLSGRFAD